MMTRKCGVVNLEALVRECNVSHCFALRNGFNSTSIRRAMTGPQLILFAGATRST